MHHSSSVGDLARELALIEYSETVMERKYNGSMIELHVTNKQSAATEPDRVGRVASLVNIHNGKMLGGLA